VQGLLTVSRKTSPWSSPFDAEQELLLALPGEVAPKRVHRDADQQDLPQ
jgi:hypothetical protein